MQKTLFEKYLEKAHLVTTTYPDFVRALRVAVCTGYRVLQTEVLGDDGVTLVETLITYDGNTALIIDRHRFGPRHDTMRSYPRDYALPIGCTVRLRHA